jgi:hypothetical protein
MNKSMEERLVYKSSATLLIHRDGLVSRFRRIMILYAGSKQLAKPSQAWALGSIPIARFINQTMIQLTLPVSNL